MMPLTLHFRGVDAKDLNNLCRKKITYFLFSIRALFAVYDSLSDKMYTGHPFGHDLLGMRPHVSILNCPSENREFVQCEISQHSGS